jgi:hypothetical protein
MNKISIITNNPLVKDEYPEQTEFLDINVKDILIRTRNYIHLGAKLLSHPLSGNLSPDKAPYKSIVLNIPDKTKPITTDFCSLTLIENAIGQLKEPPKTFTDYDEKTLEDFKTIDLDLLKNCAQNLCSTPVLRI